MYTGKSQRDNINYNTSISFPKTLEGYVILFISHRSKINMKIWKEL